jgi:CSLREA domain-containing protein
MPHKIATLKNLLILSAIFIFSCVGIVYSGGNWAYAAVFTVNSTGDSSDGHCDQPFLSSELDCTLREAIEVSNSTLGTDVVDFSIDSSFSDDGNGQWSIAIGESLPSITDTVSISAASVWDIDDDRPGIKVQGTSGINAFSFASSSAGSELQGLEISGFLRAVYISADNVIVGLNCDSVYDSQERNVIYNSLFDEIYINDVSGSVISGNYIGVLSDGITVETVSGASPVKIYGADADGNTVGFREGLSCSVEQQRNIIGAVGTYSGIILDSSAGVVTAGDVSQAPNSNIVSGNYIGVGVDGVSDVANGGAGVYLAGGSTLNFIGTDGDGIDDEFEGNLIGGWNSNGVFIFRTGRNRVSGNVVGVSADGISNIGVTGHGILARGANNIIGWCDSNTDSQLCSDAGSAINQANIVGFGSSDGIRAGADCNNCLIYGNYSGTDELNLNLGNDGVGIYVHPGLTGVRVGGPTTSHSNVVSFNQGGGIVVDGLFCSGNNCSGNHTPTDDFIVQNNIVTNNEKFGIQVLGTDVTNGGDGGTGQIIDNTVERNSGVGILIEASSPTVLDNTISNNESYGVEILSGYNDPDYLLPAPNTSGRYNPPNTTISEPVVSGNNISENSTGGIFIVNANPENLSTLYDDNTIIVDDEFAIRRDTYFSVNLSSPADSDLTDDLLTINISPRGGLTCTEVCSGTSFSESESGEALWGPEGIEADDPRTWFQITDFLVNGDGSQDEYGPYNVTVSGAVVAQYSASIETSENGDTTTSAEISAHRHSSNVNGVFFPSPIVEELVLGVDETDDVQVNSTVESLSVCDKQTLQCASQVVSPALQFFSREIGVGGGSAQLLESSHIYYARPFSLVKTNHNDTVYMIDIDQTRRPFVNREIFFTWYEDFRFVRIISELEMSSIALGPPMLPRPGMALIKLADDLKVYAVEHNMILRWIPNESTARFMYGELWQSQVLELEPYLFARYTIGVPLSEGEYPTGLLLSDGNRICQAYFGWCNEVSENGMDANRFARRFVHNISNAELNRLPMLNSITEYEETLMTERLMLSLEL